MRKAKTLPHPIAVAVPAQTVGCVIDAFYALPTHRVFSKIRLFFDIQVTHNHFTGFINAVIQSEP